MLRTLIFKFHQQFICCFKKRNVWSYYLSNGELTFFSSRYFLNLFKQRNTDSVFEVILHLLLKTLHPSFILFSVYKNTNIYFSIFSDNKILDTGIKSSKENNETTMYISITLVPLQIKSFVIFTFVKLLLQVFVSDSFPIEK